MKNARIFRFDVKLGIAKRVISTEICAKCGISAIRENIYARKTQLSVRKIKYARKLVRISSME